MKRERQRKQENKWKPDQQISRVEIKENIERRINSLGNKINKL